jgi:hypothetical protein
MLHIFIGYRIIVTTITVKNLLLLMRDYQLSIIFFTVEDFLDSNSGINPFKFKKLLREIEYDKSFYRVIPRCS